MRHIVRLATPVLVVGLGLLVAPPIRGGDGAASAPAGPAQATTWAERLGFPAGRKVLILHADDVGMCWEANAATERYLERDHIQSAAVMVPCPWFDDFAGWYREHPEEDVGLHLTLTAEWKSYRWGPVAPRAEVPGLLDEAGFLWSNVPAVAIKSNAVEVEKEIRAQLQRALDRGIRPGHIDTHMGTLYARPDFTKAYLKVAVEHDIPAMAIELTPKVKAHFAKQGYPVEQIAASVKDYPLPRLDAFYSVPSGKTYDEVIEKTFELVRSLDPGLTEIIFHPADESEGTRRMTSSWRQRATEARMWSDPKVRGFLAEQGVIFTDWKDIMRRFRARDGGSGTRTPY